MEWPRRLHGLPDCGRPELTNYSAALDFSEDSFTVAGPGALRGLRKIYSDFGDFTPSELIMRLVDRQEDEFDRLGLDKYARVMFPHLVRGRTRIKQPFAPSSKRPRLPLFYPPSWGVNDRLVELLGPQGAWPGEDEVDGELPPMDQLDLFGDVGAHGRVAAVAVE